MRDADEMEDASRERRRQAMYRHMAQHQEVAKLVAYAAFRGELPTVGPLLIRRPDFRLQNERAQRAADEEERWLATLRKRGEDGLRASRSAPSIRPARAHGRAFSARAAADSGAGGALGAEPSSLSRSSSNVPPRGQRGVGGGANAARERVRIRAQHARSLASALRDAPVAPPTHFRRATPFSAHHTIPTESAAPAPAARAERAPRPSAVADAVFAGASAPPADGDAPRARRARGASPPGARVADAPRSASWRASALDALAHGSSSYATSLCAHAPPSTAALGQAPDVSGAHGRGGVGDGGFNIAGSPAHVGFGSAVPREPLDRTREWVASGRFWAVGEGAPALPMDALLNADAAARRRTDRALCFPPPGAPRWPKDAPPAVGAHLGPGAYARPYGDRARSPWELSRTERLRPSAAFAAREVRRWAHDGVPRVGAADEASSAAVGPVGPDGFVVMPPPLLAGTEFSEFTLSATAKRRPPAHGLHALPSPPRSVDGGSEGAGAGAARVKVTLSQRQRVGLERLRAKLELRDAEHAADPANESTFKARPASAERRRVQREALTRLGGISLRSDMALTPAALTTVSSKVLDRRVA